MGFVVFVSCTVCVNHSVEKVATFTNLPLGLYHVACTWYMVRHPRGSSIRRSITIAVSRSGHTRKQMNSFDAAIHVMQESPLHIVGSSSPAMQLTQRIT